MTVKKQLQLSMEAIRYQGKSLLFNELTLTFQNFLEGNVFDQAALEKLNLSKVVYRHTKLKVDFVLDRSGGVENAYSLFPMLNVNSPLVDFLRHEGLVGGSSKQPATLAQVRQFTRQLTGAIDLEAGRVSGIFSKLPAAVGVHQQFFTSGRYLAEEIAAVTLHEIGHIFTYYERLAFFATTNMVLASALQDLSQTQDPKIRLKLVFEAAEGLDVKLEDPEAMAQSDVSAELFQSVFLKARMDPKLHTTHGSSSYDLRSFEFLSDQFATRHGAGRHLAIALTKRDRFIDHPSTQLWSRYVLVEALKAATFAVTAIKLPLLTPAVMGVLLACDGRDQNVYDEPGERLARIKRDLVQCLKDTRLKPEVRQQLLLDVEMVDAIREDVTDRRTLFGYLWTAMFSRRRDQFNQKRFQQELEGLINNGLFVTAAKFQSMAEE